MNTWERKGAVAARSGRYRDMYTAWKAAKGKPKLTARDKKLGVTFNGKMVEAKEYFFMGYQSARSNPRRKRSVVHKVKRAIGKLWTKRGKQAPRALSLNPGTQLLFKTKAAARKYAKDHGAKKYSIKKVKAGR